MVIINYQNVLAAGQLVDNSFAWILDISALPTSYTDGTGFGRIVSNTPMIYAYGMKSIDSKTVYWYTKDSSPDYQFNDSRCTYYYFAIG